jgi:hypothetical protein
MTSQNLPKDETLYEKLQMLMGNGLVNSKGKQWKKQRAICEAAFHKMHLKSIL